MRNLFASTVANFVRRDPRVVLLSGDIGNRLFDQIKTHNPSQFLNCGVAEQNMLGVAAGMGLCGLRPIIYTIAPFTTLRCLEQIKIDLGYQQSPVIIVGTGSGLSYASLGPTHHSLEDFAILRAIPNMVILAPWDSKSMIYCLERSLKSTNPTYIRIGKKGEPDLTHDLEIPPIGEGLTAFEGGEICILAVGTIASQALDACRTLRSKGIEAELIYIHSVKPLSQIYFDELLSRHEKFVTVEEHSEVGGFGEAFVSYVMKRNLSKKVKILGAADHFMDFAGSQHDARYHYKIDSGEIARAAIEILNNKTC